MKNKVEKFGRLELVNLITNKVGNRVWKIGSLEL